MVNFNKRLQIPRLYTLLRWLFLVIIAISTALVGFFQSMLISSLYRLRFMFLANKMGDEGDSVFLKFLQFAGYNLGLAWLCCFVMWVISPAASGSGIPDVKAYLNGVESPIFRNFFTIKTFIAKVISSALAVSSSLAMGKEGPMLHAGSILAVIMGSTKWMQQQMEVAAHWGTFTYNKEMRDLVAIGAACGVTTAFKAPVGGVMFAMEMSTRWGKEITWRCFMACAITILVVREAVKVCKNLPHTSAVCKNLYWGSLIWFDIQFNVKYEQVWAIILLAVLGGYLGCLYISFNTWVCVVRKKWTKFMWARIAEVCAISVVTSIFFFYMPFAGRCMPCSAAPDPDKDPHNHKCIKNLEAFTFRGLFHCHQEDHYNDMASLVFNPQGFVTQALFKGSSGAFSFTSMLFYAIVYWLLAGITYGAFIPSGLFTPSLIFGGVLGRMFAEVLVKMHVATADDVGLYAVLGAASFLGGLMRMSAAQALILMEMTAAPQMLPFLMLVLVISKNVGDCFNYGVFEHQMMLKNLAFVGLAEGNSKKFHLNAADIMSPNVLTRDDKGDVSKGATLYLDEPASALAKVLDDFRDMAAFPVTTRPPDVDDPDSRGDFVGMISRRNVGELLDEFGHEAERIDLTSKVEIAPIIIPPNMPLPFIYRIVNAEGFNYVPVIKWNGPLEGIVSRNELVEVQNTKLDKFHLKDHIAKMTHEIDQGKIIGSMHLDNNVHAQAFVNMFKNPIGTVRDVLEKDDKPIEVNDTFFVGAAEAKSMPTGSGSELRRRPGAASREASHHRGEASAGSSVRGQSMDAGVSGNGHVEVMVERVDDGTGAGDGDDDGDVPGSVRGRARSNAGVEDERAPLTGGFQRSSGV